MTHKLSMTISNPITALDRPSGFQQVEAPRFQDNRHMKVVRLSALRAGHLYLQDWQLINHTKKLTFSELPLLFSNFVLMEMLNFGMNEHCNEIGKRWESFNSQNCTRRTEQFITQTNSCCILTVYSVRNPQKESTWNKEKTTVINPLLILPVPTTPATKKFVYMHTVEAAY
jgi:hypothetical protein